MTRYLRLDKRQRIILLLKTRPDALGETASQEGHGQFGARTLQHSELWHEGSYRELERYLDVMRAKCRRIHWHTVRYYVPVRYHAGMKPRRGPAELGVTWLEQRKWDVFVPQAVSENAGFLLSEAKLYAKPQSLRRAA